ncbi:IclR family transcriptional regulator [Eilatimonas milleporae]|uniref:IclR family transcriptional regulator n=1 Tax=Eilatimonas milleporae TaxID=911205 RepID=A0A3M0CCM2_9PROT|nr:IclR family transcriptional regulator [Eilatimonas milleporae]
MPTPILNKSTIQYIEYRRKLILNAVSTYLPGLPMPPRVNAVSNAYSILRYLADQSIPKGVTEIARETNISASSSYNILKTLVELNLVAFQKDTKGYELGIGIFELARNGMTNRALLALAQPVLAKLAEQHSCQASLWELFDNSRVLVAIGQTSAIARLNVDIGTTFPIGAGSAGRIVMAEHMHNHARLKEAFDAVDWGGEFTFEEYVADVKKAAKNGFSIDRDKFFRGITTISTAFADQTTGRRYCLTIVFLSALHDRKSLASIGKKLKEATQGLVKATSHTLPQT